MVVSDNDVLLLGAVVALLVGGPVAGVVAAAPAAGTGAATDGVAGDAAGVRAVASADSVVDAAGPRRGASVDGYTTTNVDTTANGDTTTNVDTTANGDQCVGHTSTRANGVTVVSVQGARFGADGGKTAARLVAFGPEGRVLWVKRSVTGPNEPGVVWSYDVDPLGNGNLFVTATRRGTTLLYELNTTTGETVWTEELPYTDTHDADPLNETHVVIAHMRNYDAANETSDDRVIVYDRVDDEVEWTWRFAPRFDRSVGGEYTDDWTHLNDVDRVGDSFLLSPRNFDQVLLVNRSTGEIDLRLGADENHDVLHAQHNPDYLESRSGDPTFLVADSENERIVEYEHDDGEWTRTWTLGSGESFSWPRDADRLKNGHTLIGDSRNNRVVEVTPRGEVVWEVYAPWLVYDVERVPVGGFPSDAYADLGGSRGPTMADIGGTGDFALRGPGADPPSTSELEACDAALSNHTGGFGELSLGSLGDARDEDASDDAGTDAGDGSDGTGTDGAGDAGDDGGPRETVATTVPEDGTGAFAPGFDLVAAVTAAVAAAVAALVARRRR